MLGMAGVAGGPLRAGGTARLLNNGDQFFPALYEALKGRPAEHQLRRLHLGEGQGRATRSSPSSSSARGPGCRCASSSTAWADCSAPDEDIERLEDGGREGQDVPRRAPGQAHALPQAQPPAGHRRRRQRRLHRRAWPSATSGWATPPTEKQWRDSMVQVTGPLATTLQSAFVDNWAHVADDDDTGGEILLGPAFFPEFPAPVPGPGEAVALHTGIAAPPPARTIPCGSFTSRRSPPRARSSTSPTRTSCPTRRSARRWSSARSRGSTSASSCPARRRTPSPSARPATSYFEELLEAGVKIYEYQPTMMHAKTVVVDGKFSVVGLQQHGRPLQGAEPGERARHPRRRLRARRWKRRSSTT